MDRLRLVQAAKSRLNLDRDHSVGARPGSLTEIKETQINAL